MKRVDTCLYSQKKICVQVGKTEKENEEEEKGKQSQKELKDKISEREEEKPQMPFLFILVEEN